MYFSMEGAELVLNESSGNAQKSSRGYDFYSQIPEKGKTDLRLPSDVFPNLLEGPS